MEKTDKRLVSIKSQKFKRLSGRIFLSLAFLALFCLPAQADISLISDDETETLLQSITRPLFKAADIPFNSNNIFIVNDPTLNAFVGDGNRLFINTGTIISADNIDELAGVIAHESGHIEGGHIIRLKLKSQALQEAGLVSTIVAGAAAVASGRPDVGVAVLLGSQTSAMNSMAAYQTTEERSADQAAMTLLNKTEQSPQGMLAFMKKIAQQNVLNGREEIPYFRTHPVTSERITFFEEGVKSSPYKDKKSDNKAFLLVKAKLYAFLNTPQQTLSKYPLSNSSMAAEYARSIAYFKDLQFAKALKTVDTLIAQAPDNPYFKELKGQIYLETGKIKPARKEYQQALALKPSSALLQISLAQTILEDEPSAEDLRQAINMLNQSLLKHPTGFSWLLLARAYGESGNQAAANYASAEFNLRSGNFKTAQKQAENATKQARPGSPLAIKIADLSGRISEIIKEQED